MSAYGWPDVASAAIVCGSLLGAYWIFTWGRKR